MTIIAALSFTQSPYSGKIKTGTTNGKRRATTKGSGTKTTLHQTKTVTKPMRNVHNDPNDDDTFDET